MTLEGGELSARYQQEIVKVGGELAQGFVLSGVVVVGNRDEMEPAVVCSLQGLEDRAGHADAALREARAVGVGGVHVQVAAVPTGAGLDG